MKHHSSLFQSLYSNAACNDTFLKLIYNRAEKRKPHGMKCLTSLGDEIQFLIGERPHNSKVLKLTGNGLRRSFLCGRKTHSYPI